MCCQLAVNETAVKAVGRCSSLLPPSSSPPPLPSCYLHLRMCPPVIYRPNKKGPCFSVAFPGTINVTPGVNRPQDQLTPGSTDPRPQFTAQSHSPSPSTLNPIEAQLQWGSTGEFPLVKWKLDFSGRQRPMSGQGSWSSA